MSTEKNLSSVERQPRLRHSQWLLHIDHCMHAKLSHEEYCQQNCLSLKSFKKHLWRNQRKKMLKASAAESFIPVALSQSLVQETKHYEMQFPCGVLLKIPVSVSLANIIKLLKGRL